MPARAARRPGAIGLLLAAVVAVTALGSCAPGGAKTAGNECAGSRSLPRSYTDPGTFSTKITFVQTGCSVGITEIDVYAGKHLVRKSVFNPPLPAGSLTAKAGASWTGTGKFQATSQTAGTAGTVNMTQKGTFKATAAVLMAQPRGGASRQWAVQATASSQLSDKWAASQATGAPDNNAWAPASKDGGAEWIELSYADAVVPTGIDIWENNGPGFVTRVEGFDQKKKSWVKLWEGTDPTNGAPRKFSPGLAKTSLSTNRIRLTVNTGVPDWNEIAAVALSGSSPSAGTVLWLQGEWTETGNQTACVDKKCQTSPITNPPGGGWSFAFNTATAKVGTTPDQVM